MNFKKILLGAIREMADDEDDEDKEPIKTLKATKEVVKKLEAWDKRKEEVLKVIKRLKKEAEVLFNECEVEQEELWGTVRSEMDLPSSRYRMSYDQDKSGEYVIHILEDKWKE